HGPRSGSEGGGRRSPRSSQPERGRARLFRNAADRREPGALDLEAGLGAHRARRLAVHARLPAPPARARFRSRDRAVEAEAGRIARTMYFKQLYLGCLAQASYIIGSKGEAAVVDPRRDVDEYLEETTTEGLTIRHVIETHLHADFVSGHRELASRTGARIYFG